MQASSGLGVGKETWSSIVVRKNDPRHVLHDSAPLSCTKDGWIGWMQQHVTSSASQATIGAHPSSWSKQQRDEGRVKTTKDSQSEAVTNYMPNSDLHYGFGMKMCVSPSYDGTSQERACCSVAAVEDVVRLSTLSVIPTSKHVPSHDPALPFVAPASEQNHASSP